jgi:hypothetical protein
MKAIELVITGVIMLVAFYNILLYQWTMIIQWTTPDMTEYHESYLNNTIFGVHLLIIVALYIFIRSLYILTKGK